MPIVVKLDDMLYARRMTLTELAERIGITLANLSILKTGKARAVRFSTLEAICEVLQCQPGDLLEYAPSAVADEAPAAAAARPLLKRQLNTVREEA
jgi:putative transcriptional regulator